MIKPYYEQERFVFYLGDCLEILTQFPENHFDMIFADPLYHLSDGGFTCYAGKRVTVNKGKLCLCGLALKSKEHKIFNEIA